MTSTYTEWLNVPLEALPLRYYLHPPPFLCYHHTKKVHGSIFFNVGLFLLQLNHEFNSVTLGDSLGPEFGARYCERYKYEWDMPNLKALTLVLRKKSSNTNSY